MSELLNPLNCVKVACIGDDTWVVTEPYCFVTAIGIAITIPAGFLTDGASVPRCLWSAIPPFGLHFNAAVVHDFLYREQDPEKKLPKTTCDGIFHEIMVRDGVDEVRREAMYMAVVTMGFSSYLRGKAAAAASFASEEEKL